MGMPRQVRVPTSASYSSIKDGVGRPGSAVLLHFLYRLLRLPSSVTSPCFMVHSSCEFSLYKRIQKTTSEHHKHNIQTHHQTSLCLDKPLNHTRNHAQHRPYTPVFYQSLFTMSSSSNQQGQGQAGRGSNTPTSTMPQSETQTQTSADQYPNHATYNSSGSLQRAGAGVMQQQLGQYYLYMSSTQSSAGQQGQAARGSPSGSQGGQSNGSGQGR